MIEFLETPITPEEYNRLHESVGWGTYSEEIISEALSHNLYSISAYDGEKIIGYGRLIGDKTIFLYIHDVMVVPEYQLQKIGTTIIEKILSKAEEFRAQNPYIRLYLGAAIGKEGFYEKLGFVAREDAGLGKGMVLLKK